jgi:hypothetical protein
LRAFFLVACFLTALAFGLDAAGFVVVSGTGVAATIVALGVGVGVGSGG